MKVNKETKYTLEMTREEFVALYEFIGNTSARDREAALSEADCSNTLQKSILIGDIWDTMHESENE